MNIYVGLDTFLEKMNPHSTDETLKQWYTYYYEYKKIFDTLFQTLYMANIQQLEPIIHTLDINQLRINAENGLKKYPLSEIEKILYQCVHHFHMKDDFDVFLLVGFGHINGAAPPSKHPFLYMGLERLADSDIHILIPHEFNHLVRFHHLRHIEPIEPLSVKQLAIAEGLATITPLMMNNQILNDDTFIQALMISPNEYANVKGAFLQIENEIQKELHHTITPPLMQKYFMVNQTGELPIKAGYYYGLTIIATLIQQGMSLTELTYKPTDEILSLYKGS